MRKAKTINNIIRLKGIEYDEYAHIYSHNGEKIPSVTRLINTKDMFKDVPKDVLDKAAKLGTELHQDIDYYIHTGEIWDDRMRAFDSQFSIIKSKYGDVISTEQTVGAEIDGIKYAGRYDIMLERAIVEIKRKVSSSKLARQYALQLAAYAIASDNYDNIETFIIMYMDNNKWKIKVFNDTEVNAAIECFIYGVINRYKSEQLINDYFNKLI
jgi:hypothetical protein